MPNLRGRLQTLERVCRPKHDGMYTLEELCRMMWRQSKKNYLKRIEKGCWGLRHFVLQFEREDAERAKSSRTAGRG